MWVFTGGSSRATKYRVRNFSYLVEAAGPGAARSDVLPSDLLKNNDLGAMRDNETGAPSGKSELGVG
jgi:hypothetical protein